MVCTCTSLSAKPISGTKSGVASLPSVLRDAMASIKARRVSRSGLFSPWRSFRQIFDGDGGQFHAQKAPSRRGANLVIWPGHQLHDAVYLQLFRPQLEQGQSRWILHADVRVIQMFLEDGERVGRLYGNAFQSTEPRLTS